MKNRNQQIVKQFTDQITDQIQQLVDQLSVDQQQYIIEDSDLPYNRQLEMLQKQKNDITQAQINAYKKCIESLLTKQSTTLDPTVNVSTDIDHIVKAIQALQLQIKSDSITQIISKM